MVLLFILFWTLVGLAMYHLCKSPKWSTTGELLFLAGCIAFLMRYAGFASLVPR